MSWPTLISSCVALLLFLSAPVSHGLENGAGNCPTLYEQGMLGKINELRRLHGAPELVLSSDVSAYSAKWAAQLAQTGQMAHQPDNLYNADIVFQSEAGGASPQYINQGPGVAFDLWKNRYSQYLHKYYGHEPDPALAGNYNYFSQFIWRATTQLGVGCAIGATPYGQYFYVVVLNFNPYGNVICQYKANVWPVTTDPLWERLQQGEANRPEPQCQNQNFIGQGDQPQNCTVCPDCSTGGQNGTTTGTTLAG